MGICLFFGLFTVQGAGSFEGLIVVGVRERVLGSVAEAGRRLGYRGGDGGSRQLPRCRGLPEETSSAQGDGGEDEDL